MVPQLWRTQPPKLQFLPGAPLSPREAPGNQPRTCCYPVTNDRFQENAVVFATQKLVLGFLLSIKCHEKDNQCISLIDIIDIQTSYFIKECCNCTPLDTLPNRKQSRLSYLHHQSPDATDVIDPVANNKGRMDSIHRFITTLSSTSDLISVTTSTY